MRKFAAVIAVFMPWLVAAIGVPMGRHAYPAVASSTHAENFLLVWFVMSPLLTAAAILIAYKFGWDDARK